MPIQDSEDYRLLARETFQQSEHRFAVMFGVQADYGKWLIATLSLIHSGALYALATSKVDHAQKDAFVPFLVGLLLALTCGLLTWINYNLQASTYMRWADPRMLANDDHWPRQPAAKGIDFTMWGGIIAGIASALCIAWGALTAVN